VHTERALSAVIPSRYREILPSFN